MLPSPATNNDGGIPMITARRLRSALLSTIATFALGGVAPAWASDSNPAATMRGLVLSPSARGLWSTESPLPAGLFSGNTCSLSTSLSPPNFDVQWYSFYRLLEAGYKDMYAGFCLTRAGLPNEAREAFLESRTQLTAAFQKLVETAEEQANKQRELAERQERIRAMQQALNTLAPVLRPGDAQRAANFDQNMRLMNIMSDVQISALSREISAIRVLPATRLDQTIRLPVVPVAGFSRLLVRVTNERGHCTGSFVGPRIVLTNLHCVGRRMQVSRDLIFYQEQYKVTRWHTAAGVNYVPQGNEVQERFWDDDWALLEIAGPRGDENEYLTVQPGITASDPIMIAGYSGDVSGGRYLTLDVGCPIVGLTAAKVRYQCSTAPGSSGSPVLSPTDHRVLVGLHHAGERLDREVSAVSRSSRLAVRVERFQPTLQRLLDSRRPLPSANPQWEAKLASLRQERGTPIPTLRDFPPLE
jgi:V8-like Glu-specific endopeptidase